jgi:peroxiredoxin
MKRIFTFILLIITSLSIQSQTLLDTAIDFTETTTEGQEINLFGILDQDIIVLIDFFSTTCNGCNTYAPEFQKAYENFGCNTGNVFFIGIDKWNSHDAVVAFDQLHGIEFPSIAGSEGGYGVFQDWLVASTPSLVIVAPDRSIKDAQIWPPTEQNITSSLEMYGGVQQPCNQGIFGNKYNQLDISISPNPAKEYVMVSFSSGDAGEYKASIVNLTGAVVKEFLNYHSPGIAYFELELNDIPAGMYMIFLSRNEELVSSEKLMIMN